MLNKRKTTKPKQAQAKGFKLTTGVRAGAGSSLPLFEDDNTVSTMTIGVTGTYKPPP